VESNDVKTHTGERKGSNTVLEATWETYFPGVLKTGECDTDFAGSELYS
jgi:hypothetical protein